MEVYEKLDKAISDALDKLDPASSTYAEDVEAVVKLYNVKNQTDKNQNDYYIRAEELANETARIDVQKTKDEKEAEYQKEKDKEAAKWYNKVNWTQVGTSALATGGVTLAMLASMAFQKEGYIGLNPLEITKILLNKASR